MMISLMGHVMKSALTGSILWKNKLMYPALQSRVSITFLKEWMESLKWKSREKEKSQAWKVLLLYLPTCLHLHHRHLHCPHHLHRRRPHLSIWLSDRRLLLRSHLSRILVRNTCHILLPFLKIILRPRM